MRLVPGAAVVAYIVIPHPRGLGGHDIRTDALSESVNLTNRMVNPIPLVLQTNTIDLNIVV